MTSFSRLFYFGAKPARTLDPRGLIVQSERHTFRLQALIDEVQDPWGLAFLPDGRMLVTERAGRLRVVEDASQVAEAVAGTPRVWAKGQGGLLDVAVHPQFSRNGWIHLTYSDPGSGDYSMTTLARGRLVENTWVQQRALFKLSLDVYRHSPIHFGSRIVFDGSGWLYFSGGDRGFGEDAQDLTRPNGTIHRVADDGNIPEDNPLPAKTEGFEAPVREWTPSIGVSSIVFYTGDAFPHWKGNLFVTSLLSQELRRLVIEGGRVVHEEILFNNLGRVRNVVNGPDGYLYVVFNSPDRIARLTPATRLK